LVVQLAPPRRPLPDPGDDFVWEWAPDQWFVRVFHAHPARPPLVPRRYGPIGRFDPHVRDKQQRAHMQADGRGVIYIAEDLSTALAEGLPGRRRPRVCPNRHAILVAPSSTAALLDLTGNGAMKIGALATLGSGKEPRRRTQPWAQRIYEDLPRFDGVLYRGAHQGGLCIALWDRAPALRVHPTTPSPLGDRLLDPGMDDRTQVALASQGRKMIRTAAARCSACRAAGLVVP
jgi:hypothetical protein